METEILVAGDSWASAWEGDTGRDEGWPLLLGIPREYRQGKAGSTAAEWAADRCGMLTKAVNTPSKTVIISLIGNDVLAAVADGNITVDEVAGAYKNFTYVLHMLQRERTLVMLYADPYCGTNESTRFIVLMINAALRALCRDKVEFVDCSPVLTPLHFHGTDMLHPNKAGHGQIAKVIAEMLK